MKEACLLASSRLLPANQLDWRWYHQPPVCSLARLFAWLFDCCLDDWFVCFDCSIICLLGNQLTWLVARLVGWCFRFFVCLFVGLLVRLLGCLFVWLFVLCSFARLFDRLSARLCASRNCLLCPNWSSGVSLCWVLIIGCPSHRNRSYWAFPENGKESSRLQGHDLAIYNGMPWWWPRRQA